MLHHIPQSLNQRSSIAEAFIGIFCQRLHQHRIQFRWEMGRNPTGTGRRRLRMGDNQLRRCPGEGHPPSDNLVGDHAEGIEITAAVYAARFGLFRRNILGRSHKNTRTRQPFGIRVRWLSNPKIGQQHAAIGIDQHIVRFDITMHRPPAVGIIQGAAQRFQDADRVSQSQRVTVVQNSMQRAPLDELHGDIVQPELILHIILINIIDGHNSRVVQVRSNNRLAVETPGKLRVHTQLGRQHFERNRALEHRIQAPIHPRHTTATYFLLNLIATKLFSDELGQTWVSCYLFQSGACVTRGTC